jgi:hypothetical protein
MSTKSDKVRDRVARDAIESRANKSLAVLEKAFIRNASGRYVVLRQEVRTERKITSPAYDKEKVKA